MVCGAGIAGVSTAFHLVRHGCDDVLLVDPRPPLTLTSDKSTECYRNWWPSLPMVQLMNRSIDLLEEYAIESGDAFGMNRRGYLFVTSDQARAETMGREAATTSGLGAGPLRVHRGHGDGSYLASPASGFTGAPDGADLIVGRELLASTFPYLTEGAAAALHVRRAGWLSAQQLGAWMLDRFLAAGGMLVRGEISAIGVDDGRVSRVTIDGTGVLTTRAVVNAAGPLLRTVGALVDVDLPVHSELHQKVALRDHRGGFPRLAPMLIWGDEQELDWSPEERSELTGLGRSDVLGTLPRFCHGRPEGGDGSPWALGLWEWRRNVLEPTWPLPEDPLYPELVVRGLSTMLPAMAGYLDGLPESAVDGGYYTKTAENRPLSGPVGPDGSFVCGALSGFGVMAACALGELTALHVIGASLPAYAPAFMITRYQDPAYRAWVQGELESGQL